MNAYCKETKKAAKDGNLDENEADPVPFTLFKMMIALMMSQQTQTAWSIP